MPLFRKLPLKVEARQFFKDNVDEIFNFVGDLGYLDILGCFFIDTKEGRLRARSGDWIIKGVDGEFYPVKQSIFNKTYEPVEATHAKEDA